MVAADITAEKQAEAALPRLQLTQQQLANAQEAERCRCNCTARWWSYRCYRTAQELVNNLVQHAGATKAHLHLATRQLAGAAH